MTDVSVAIFTSRETVATLRATVDSALHACARYGAVIDIVVNGNRALADETARTLAASSGNATLRLWFLALGDKANAWNWYIDAIAPAATSHFFIDGYVRPAPDSIDAMHRRLVADDVAWAAAAVPSVGRSSARQRDAMLRDGGLHGNLYAFRHDVVTRMKEDRVRIPLGLYRNDSLLGSIVLFGGDPATGRWDRRRLAVVADATWSNDVLVPWSLDGLATQWKRIQRQARGDLENAAMRQHLARERRPPEALPRTTLELVEAWRRAAPDEAAAMLRHPLRRRAYRALLEPRDWRAADDPPFAIALRASA